VHVGIVNSVVHHPNTQSVSFLLSAVLGMLMLAGYAHGYIAAQTHILLALFFSKLKNFWTEFENQVVEFHCTTRHAFFKTA